MSKTNPKIKKGSEDRGTVRFHHRQAKSIHFIRNKEKPFRRCEDIKYEIFKLVP